MMEEEKQEAKVICLRRANPEELAELVIQPGNGPSLVFVLRDSQVRNLARDAVEDALRR